MPTPTTIAEMKSLADQTFNQKSGVANSITPVLEGNFIKDFIDFQATYYLATASKNDANGVAGLDGDGFVLASSLPTIAATKGGTGITTYTAGDIIFSPATNVLGKLAKGTDGQVLTMVSGAPAWAAAAGGGVALSAITAATSTHTIVNAAYDQEWQWTGIASSGYGIKMSAASTNALNNTSATAPSILCVAKSGAHTGINTYTRAASFINTSTGTGTRNTAIYVEASGGSDSNLAIDSNGDIAFSKGSKPTLYFDITSQASGYIQRDGTYLLFDGLSGGTYFKPRNATSGWCITNVNPTNFYDAAITLSPQSSTKQAIIMGGDAYRSYGTTVVTIERVNSQLIFSANTGTTSGFGGSYTPNNIMTVYGVNSNVGIGTITPAACAKIEVSSTTQGVLPARMTTTQKNAIASPTEGLEVYDLTLHKKCIYTGSAWETITSS